MDLLQILLGIEFALHIYVCYFINAFITESDMHGYEMICYKLFTCIKLYSCMYGISTDAGQLLIFHQS